MNIFNNFLLNLAGATIVLSCYTNFTCASGGYYSKTQLCKEGYYLSSCNQVNVGTNWLKGIRNNAQTSDFYSYGLSAADSTNMTNLRKFFAGVEPIVYTDINGNQQTVLPSEYINTRNEILRKFCIVANGSSLIETKVECKKCPNNAKTKASVVDYSFGNSTNSNISTIADCYMDEFSDNTGTYIYVQNSAPQSADAGKKCYYSNEIKGDELISE